MKHSAAVQVTLERATAGALGLLSNLMELYIHDLSALFPHVSLGEEGRYGYPELPSYVSGSGERWAFVIRCGGQVAGFALVQRGSPASDDPSALDVAEFFVLRPLRAHGVGREAAEQLWNSQQGKWTVRAASANPDAVRFWRSVVANYAGDHATEAQHSAGAKNWIVFSFCSPA